MNIRPVRKYSGILPAAAALLSSIVTGCDRQNIGGSVPDHEPEEREQQPIGRYLITPEEPCKADVPEPDSTAETPTAAQPEATPQQQEGDISVKNPGREH